MINQTHVFPPEALLTIRDIQRIYMNPCITGLAVVIAEVLPHLHNVRWN